VRNLTTVISVTLRRNPIVATLNPRMSEITLASDGEYGGA